MYPIARSGLNSDGVSAFGPEPMCAAWQTWQAASFCPLAWKWFRACPTNRTNRTARERANTLTKSSLVLCLPTISILRLPQCSLWTPGLFRSEHPCVLWNSSHKSVLLLYSGIVSLILESLKIYGTHHQGQRET